MATNSNAQQTKVAPTSASSQGSGSGNRNWVIYIIAAVAIVILIGLAYVLLSSVNSTPSQTITQVQNSSENTTSDYMSAAQVQGLLGGQVSDYYAYDLFNPNAPVNITDLEAVVPALYGNVTSGWTSSGSVVNATYNVSIQYYVMKTTDQVNLTQQLSSALTYGLNMSPTVVSPGVYNGLTYSYSLYQNSTSTFQVLTGWKGNNVVLMLLESAPAYAANQTQFIDTAANDTT